jgi:hypothetical protein
LHKDSPDLDRVQGFKPEVAVNGDQD